METLAVELGAKWLNRFCKAMPHRERGAAGIEAGSTQGWRGLARVARRRPWEPPQARWGSPRQPRTTAESPAAAQKKPIKKRLQLHLNPILLRQCAEQRRIQWNARMAA
jgi:hypothetical protein